MIWTIISFILLCHSEHNKKRRKEKEGGGGGERRGGLDFEGEMHSHLSLACL